MFTYLPSVPNASRIATAITLLFTVTFCFGEVQIAHGQTASFPTNRTGETSNIRRIPMPKKHLPANPNLDRLKHQAKDLKKAYQSGDTDAFRQIREFHLRFSNASDAELQAAEFKLTDAQLVIAREYGFGSFPQLKRHLELGRTIRDSRDHALWGWDSDGYYVREVNELLRAHQKGLRWAAVLLKAHHPDFAEMSIEGILVTSLSEEAAQLGIAREKGCASWEELSERAKLLGNEPTENADENVKAAFEAVQSGDADGLDSLLQRDPSIVHATMGNNTLLENAASVSESFDISRETRRRMMRALITAGARMERSIWTSNEDALDFLIEAGALDLDEYPAFLAMKSAMLHGNADTVDYWKKRGIKPRGFWMAAGTGDIDLVKSYFNEDGSLKPLAASDRPNLADIGWWEERGRSDDPKEVLNEGFCIAIMNRRREVVSYLLDRGADANFAPPGLGGWSPLFFAISGESVELASLLIEQGANVNYAEANYGDTPMVFATHVRQLDILRLLLNAGADINKSSPTWRLTPLHVAARNGFPEIVDFLLKNGADPTIREEENNATPFEYAKHEQRHGRASYPADAVFEVFAQHGVRE